MTASVHNLFGQDHTTKPPPEYLAQGGGGGDNGGMDGRLAHLEKRVDSIDGRLGRIEGDVASLKDGLADVKIAIASLDAKLDIGGIRASVEKAHTDIYKWVATLAIGILGLGSAVYFGLQRVQQQLPVNTISVPASVSPQTSPPAPTAPAAPPSQK